MFVYKIYITMPYDLINFINYSRNLQKYKESTSLFPLLLQ